VAATEPGKAINTHLHLFQTVASIVLDHRVPDDYIRPLTFNAIPEAQLQQAVAESAVLVQPQDFNVFAFLGPKYGHLRSFLSAVVQTLPFTGTAAARPVVEALAFLRHFDAAKPKWRKLPPDTPLAFVDDRWYSAVCPVDGTIDHRMWLLCLAEQIRRRLRSSDLLVPGSRQHRAWDSYLHAPAAWAQRKPSWFVMWHGPPEVDVYLQQLAARYEATMQQVAATWSTNTFARIEDGRLALSRDEKIPIPDSAKALRTALLALLPRVTLPTLLIEVDSWVHVRQHFTHPNAAIGRTWAVRDPALDVTLFAVILAQGCNLPLTTMADAASLPYHHLVHTADWYVREATIRQAIIALVNYHHNLPLAATFGAGTSAMSDGIRFGVTARSLYARHNPRLPTRGRGVTVYDMTSDQGSQPYVDVIRCDIRESAAVLDAALHHETELPLTEHFTDTHGYTELMFGLFELESRVFSPRIRDLAAQVLYPLERHHRQGRLGALFRGPRIRPERIRANWDEMHRIAASLQDGTVTAQLLVSKLQALKQQHGAHTGIQELGRIFKTLTALSYISDEGYRRRIHHTLNKGELLHALARDVFFGQQGLFRERDYGGQLNRATCMSLIINAIVVWNTRYLLVALDHLRDTGYPVTDDDLKHVTPLLWEHITFHGSYHFDLGEPQRYGGLRPLRAQDGRLGRQPNREDEAE
jgi:TnpA family transposase